MKHDLNYYRKIQGVNGTASAKEAEIRLIKSELSRDFANSIDCEAVTINGASSLLLITKTNDDTIKRVISKPDENVYLGDVISWLNTNWIVDTVDADTRINNRGKMRRCNIMLKWKDENGAIHSYPGFCEDATKYSEGVTGGKLLQIGEFQIKIKIHLDTNSAKLNRDRRFLLDVSTYLPQIESSGNHVSAYVVTRRNVLTGNHNGHGYVELTLVECAYSDETDNPQLMIADYYSTDDVYELTVTNVGSDLVVSEGSTFTISASATLNGTALNQSSICFQTSDASVATVSSEGKIAGVANGTCTVTVKAGNAKKEISLSVKSEADRVVVSSDSGSMEVIYGETVKLIARAYVDGLENTSAVFTFQIGSDTPDLATISSFGDNYVVIKANSDSSIIGEVINIVVNTYGSTTIHPVTIRGWF